MPHGQDPPVAVGHHQTPLLQFLDVNLESGFRVYHNQLLGNLDILWAGFGLSLIPITALGNTYFRSQNSPLLEWARLFMYPLLGLTIRMVWPQAFIRHREAIWVAHRMDILFGTSLPHSFVFRDPGSTRLFAFGLMGSLMNSIGHKVRFHVQVILSIIMFCISLAFMIYTQRVGVFTLTPSFFIAHTVLSVLMPCVITYVWDKYTRRLFLENITAGLQ